ncbi:hypothetical protein N9K80_02710 [Flavobacteriaceae bacterium]|nr:hypothetical protein [Flavobacteriaceae bacterium]
MKNVLFLLIALGTVSVQAQRNLKGKILFYNAPLEGVRIKLNNEEMAERSNQEGDFSIEVKEGDFIYFNSLGMQELSLRIDDVTAKLTLEMRPEVTALDEVVISRENRQKKPFSILDKPIAFKTSFATINPETAGFSTMYIKGEDLNKNYSNIFEAIRFRTRIRNGATFGLTTGVLWDIDGFIYNDQTVVESIDISSVEDILVLRSLAATALYGSQASGGVIAIRTKNQLLKQKQDIVAKEKLLFNTNIEKSFFAPYEKRNFYFNGMANEGIYASKETLLSKDYLQNFITTYRHNPDLLKKLAFYLDAEKRTDLSIALYREILMQRPSYAQSFRDLAQAFLRNAQTQKSWETYMKYILRGKKMDQLDGIEGIVYDEIWNLERNYPISRENMALIRLSDRYKETPPQPIRFVVEWGNPLDQFSLTFLNPDKQIFNYEHQLPKQQKAILKEQLNGYSATSFFLDHSLKGSWSLLGKAHSKADTPVSLKITQYEDWGTKNQKETVYFYQLFHNQATQNLLTFTVE